jgi:nitrate reductase molybdenum cofactor assembly chaperone
VWKLISKYQVALPLHPEYRTMPMVWYIPPLSPVVDVIRDTGHDAEDAGNLFAAIDTLRIPVEYLANLFTAGDVAPVDGAAQELAAMRSYMREQPGPRARPDDGAGSVGMSEEDLYEMFRLLAIAKYADRYVIPTAHAEQAHALEELATECALDGDGGVGMGGSGPVGEGSGRPMTPVAIENLRVLQGARAESEKAELVSGGSTRGRVNLLTWDGKGIPAGMFPADGARTSDVPAHAAYGRSRRLPDDQLRIAWQACSLLLDYPTETLVSRLGLVRQAAGELPAYLAEPVCRLVDHVEATPLGRLQRDYVETFDHTRRGCLYLTYFTAGDTRKRGVALVRLKQAYRRAGLELTSGELPDHLGVSCWSSGRRPTSTRPGGSSTTIARASRCCECRCRRSILRGLTRSCAISRTLPELVGDDAEAIARLIEQGPPSEDVGLAPYPTRWTRALSVPCPTISPLEPTDDDLPVGHLPLPVSHDLRRRALLALPLRQVRVDDALQPALRGPPAADRVAAVPLRDARRRRRPPHRPGHPPGLDRRDRA